MARKQRSKGRGPGAPQGQGAPQQRPQGGGAGGGWGTLRDSIRRDIEQAVSALAFAERLHQKMDTQRRLFLDFPRALEQLRSGAIERLAVALSRLYEGGQGFDLQRFLRDLPLALAQLAVADRSKSAPPPPETLPEGDPAASAGAAPAQGTPAPPLPTPTATEPPPAASTEASPSTPSTDAAGKVSPRLELRAKLLAAAPQLAKAAASYRRNVATLRRAALPRRSPGPWRADREVLEEARRAVEFVHKLYDAYAEAWADQPVTAGLYEETAAEIDRFLAWTQLDRYVELAVMASTNAPRPPKPGQQVISAPRESVPPPAAEAQGTLRAHVEEAQAAAQPVTEASPGAVVASSDPGPAGEQDSSGETDAGSQPASSEPEPERV